MIDIVEVINERKKYEYDGVNDTWLDDILRNKPNKCTILIPVSLFTAPRQLSCYGSILDEYNIEVLLKFKYSLAKRGINWYYLITLTKSKVNNIVLGIYPEEIWSREQENFFSEAFQFFIDDVNSAIRIQRSKKNNIYVREYSHFDKHILNPLWYSDKAIKIRNDMLKKKECFKNLDEIAQINPNCSLMKCKKVLVVNSAGSIEIHEFDKIQERFICEAKIGDIIIRNSSKDNNISLSVVEENYECMTINTNLYTLIRLNDISMLYYINFYLNDEKIMLYVAGYTSTNFGNFISASKLKKFPIYMPDEQLKEDSKTLYEIQNRKKQYASEKINSVLRRINNEKSNSATEEFVNSVLSKALSSTKNQLAYKVVNDDLKELQICYDDGAYKASVILCGSILEAILLDWLYEYQSEDEVTSFIESAKTEHGGRSQDMELKQIIDKLAKLIKPKWDEKDKAHEIRKKRNLVHPKVYLKSEIKLTEEECKKVIDFLKDIIQSRISRE